MALVYSNPDFMTNGGVSKMTVLLYCSKGHPYEIGALTRDGDMSYLTYVKDEKLCPVFEYNSFARKIQEWPALIAIALIVFGGYLALFGRQFFPVICFVFGTAMSTVALLLLSYVTFLAPASDEPKKKVLNWTIVIIASLIGILIGLISTKLQRFAAAFLAGWGGFVLTVLIDALFLENQTNAVYWSLLFVLTFVAALLSLIWYNQAIMLATALVGSYFFVRGVGIFAGGFPNEYVLVH